MNHPDFKVYVVSERGFSGCDDHEWAFDEFLAEVLCLLDGAYVLIRVMCCSCDLVGRSG